MEKDLRDYVADLEALRIKHERWEDTYDFLAENHFKPDVLESDVFPHEQVHMHLPKDRKSLAQIFARSSVIQDRVMVQTYAFNLRKMASLMDILNLEMALRKLNYDENANILNEAQIADVQRIAELANKITEVRNTAPIALKHHQIKDDPHLDYNVLTSRFQSVITAFKQRSEEGSPATHLSKDEIQLLEDLHDTRLGYAALHADQASMFLDQANDIMLQRVQLIAALAKEQMMADDPLVLNVEELMDLSATFGSHASSLIKDLDQYYKTMEKSGLQSGSVFVVTGFVPMDVSFKF